MRFPILLSGDPEGEAELRADERRRIVDERFRRA